MFLFETVDRGVETSHWKGGDSQRCLMCVLVFEITERELESEWPAFWDTLRRNVLLL